jgi:PAS domain S-box-containing protein
MLVALGIATAAWRNRDALAARILSLLAVAVAVWSGGTVGVVLATSFSGMLTWLKLSYVGIVFVPPGFAVLALEYTGRHQYVTKRTVGGLLGLSVLFLVLVWTNPGDGWYWDSVQTDDTVPEGITTTPGPGFVGFAVFTYALLTVGSVLFIRYVIRAPELYRQQTAALLLSAFVPWAANVPHVLQLVDTDLTPVALSVTVAALGYAMFRYRLTDITPVAHRTILQSISPGIYVFDDGNRLVEVNTAGKELLELDDDALGSHVSEVVPDEIVARLPDEMVDAADETGQRETVLTFEQGTETRHYAVQIAPIERNGRGSVGRVVVVNDITQQHNHQQRLEDQKEQLDEFASVISHDLRNPLNVASLRLALAKEECESQHLETVDDSLERMEALIDDLLTLARQGKHVQDTEPVDLSDLVEECWKTVLTGDASIEIETTQTIQADESRLQQLLENLITNAVEHGGSDVTITVGDRPNGFYVADDGRGIPPDDRADMFERGYSTAEGGTGFGLKIVEQVATAHGWDVQVTDSESGGARFEITGVSQI